MADLTSKHPEYHYGEYKNVINHLELERMLTSFGPSEGQIIRPSDLKHPKRILFISCVGSRSLREGYKPYCCNVGCMAAMKEARLIAEHHPDTQIDISYMDVRSSGKGYEEFWEKATHDYGINYFRGRVAELYEDEITENIIARLEDTLLNQLFEIEYDLVILVGAVDQMDDLPDIVKKLNLQQGSDGWVLEAHPKLRPVDTHTGGIFVAGFVTGPKDIPATVSQAKAAASGVAALILQKEVEIEPYYAVIDPELCGACKKCEVTCPFGAAILVTDREQEGKILEINSALCTGCGTCVAECKYGAIEQNHFTSRQLFASTDRASEKLDLDIADSKWEPKILIFTCNWCSYTGADLAGTSRIQYPPNARIIRMMCSGRFELSFGIQALLNGFDGVMVGGCHPGDCHYVSGNYKMERRAENMSPILRNLGIDTRRFRLEWCSASEGLRWAELNKQFVEELKTLGPSPMRERVRLMKNTIEEFKMPREEKVRVKIITKNRSYKEGKVPDILKFIDEILKTYKVIAPIKFEGKLIQFNHISSSSEIVLDPVHQSDFSFKQWLLPRNQSLLQYNMNKNDITIDDSIDPLAKQQILFGLHSCDLHSIQILDKIFLEEEDLDVHYKKLRENTLIIGFGCSEPFKNCFCASVNTIEPPDGTFDLFFYLNGKKFYVFEGSSEGAELLKILKSKISPDGEKQIALINKHLASAQNKTFPLKEDIGTKIKETYCSEFWDGLGKKCFGCAGCTIVCPTCYCFFVDDEVDYKEKKKIYRRIRDWDSCTLTNWALAAGGHNFQNNRGIRLNRRFMHKFGQLKTKIGRIGCVGCGRCIDICPTGASNPVNVIKDLFNFKN